MRIYIKHFLYLYVLIVFSVSHAGSYEDYFGAIRSDNAGAIEKLLQRGFDPNTLDPNKQHGLYLALREPSPKAAKLLINWPKTDLNIANEVGETPLMMAVIKGHTELAAAMLAKDADVNKTGWTPLHYAATTGNNQIITMLLEKHAYIDAESPNGSTPLMLAAMYGSATAVKLLLDGGADPLLKNQIGMTAIDFAEKAERKEVVDMIATAVRAKQPKG
ncbi:MAG: ankyrin repeat domain-containing protein, partial [Burkholderiaceae bacterium]